MVFYMVEVPNSQQDFRYEKKFFTSSEFLNEIYLFLKTSPIGFQEIFTSRKVNSLYLDNVNHDSYLDSISGISSRSTLIFTKFLFINSATVESSNDS